jgi:hypothetical protein
MLVSDLILSVLPRVCQKPLNVGGITVFQAATAIQSLIYKNLLDRGSDLQATGNLSLSIAANGYYATLPAGFIAMSERPYTEEVADAEATITLEPNYLHDDVDDEGENWWTAATTGSKPKTFKIIGSTIYIRPATDVAVILKGKYSKVPTAFAAATETIPWEGVFDQIFVEGCVRMILKGVAIPDIDADFMAMFKREFDTVVFARSRLMPRESRIKRSNFI